MSDSRYFRIAAPEVAEALEVFSRVVAARPTPRPSPSRQLQPSRRARLCYDHLAGEHGVTITSAIVDRGWLVPENCDFHLTTSGEEFFAGLGIDFDAAHAKRCMFARQCSTGANDSRTSRAPSGLPSWSAPSRKAG